MSFAVEASDLTVRYGTTVAVDRATFTLAPGKIYGLLGRNGSGKTSLLSTIAAFRPSSGGILRVDGEDPYENARVMAGTTLIREGGDFLDERVKNVLAYSAAARSTWDAELAARLADRFELDPKAKLGALSRGKRSALGVVVGLAARSPLTMFDEAYLGLDAPSRYAFYDEVLASYAEHPRTIVISSHLIEEVERLFEHVLVLDEGRIVIDEDADTLRARGTTVTGPAEVVESFTEGRSVVGLATLGPTVRATVYGELDDVAIREARTVGLELGPVPLQDLFVHLTAKDTR